MGVQRRVRSDVGAGHFVRASGRLRDLRQRHEQKRIAAPVPAEDADPRGRCAVQHGTAGQTGFRGRGTGRRSRQGQHGSRRRRRRRLQRRQRQRRTVAPHRGASHRQFARSEHRRTIQQRHQIQHRRYR